MDTNFRRWTENLAKEINEPPVNENIHEDVREHNEWRDKGDDDYTYPCKCCGEDILIDDPEDFDPGMALCGRNPHCMP